LQKEPKARSDAREEKAMQPPRRRDAEKKSNLNSILGVLLGASAPRRLHLGSHFFATLSTAWREQPVDKLVYQQRQFATPNFSRTVTPQVAFI
jgi:hypothetical protein